MKLSRNERLMFINQLLILEKLDSGNTQYYEIKRKALEEGYELHYEELFEGIYDGLSADKCKEVLSILDMYRAITWSYMREYDTKVVKEERIKFKGFDGNSEAAHAGYCRYFVNDLNRFEELTYGKKLPDFNSHAPMLDVYKRQLVVWKGLGEMHERMHLSMEQIDQILGA